MPAPRPASQQRFPGLRSRSELRPSALVAFLVVLGRIVAAPVALFVFVACSRYLTTATVLIGSDDSYFAYSQMDPLMRGGCPNCNIGCLNVFVKLAHFTGTLLLSKPAYEDLFPPEEYDYNLLSDAAKALAARIDASETSTCMSGIDEWGSRAVLISGTPREVLDAVEALGLSVAPKVLREVENALASVEDCPSRWVLDSHSRVFRFRALANSTKLLDFSTIPAADVSIFPEYTECRGDVSNDGLIGEKLTVKTHGTDLVADVPDRMRVFPYSFRSSMAEVSTEIAAGKTIYNARTVTQQMLRAYYDGCRVRVVNTTGVYIEEGCKMDAHWLHYGLMIQTPDDLPVCSIADVCVHNYYNSLWEFVTWTDPSDPNRFASAVNSFRVRYADAVGVSMMPALVVAEILAMGWVSFYQTLSHKRSVLLTQIWAYRCQSGRMQVAYLAQTVYHLVYYSDLYHLGLTTGTLTVESVGNLTTCLFAFSYSFVNLLRARVDEQQLDRHFRLAWELVQLLSTSVAGAALYQYRATSISVIMESFGELLRKTSARSAKYCNLSDSCLVFRVNMGSTAVLVSLGLGAVAFAIKLGLRLLVYTSRDAAGKQRGIIGLRTTSVVPVGHRTRPARREEEAKLCSPVSSLAMGATDEVMRFTNSDLDGLTSFEQHCLGNKFARLFRDCDDFAYVTVGSARCTSVEAVLLAGFVFYGDHVYLAPSMTLLLLSRVLPRGFVRTFNVLLVRWRVDQLTRTVQPARMRTWYMASAGGRMSIQASPIK